MASSEYISGLVDNLYSKLQGNILEQEQEISSGLAFQDGFEAEAAGGTILENNELFSKYFGDAQDQLEESQSIFEQAGGDARAKFRDFNRKRRAALRSLKKAQEIDAPKFLVSGDLIDPLTGQTVGEDFDPMTAFADKFKRKSFDSLVTDEVTYQRESLDGKTFEDVADENFFTAMRGYADRYRMGHTNTFFREGGQNSNMSKDEFYSRLSDLKTNSDSALPNPFSREAFLDPAIQNFYAAYGKQKGVDAPVYRAMDGTLNNVAGDLIDERLSIFDMSSDSAALRKAAGEGNLDLDQTLESLKDFYNTTADTSQRRTQGTVEQEFQNRIQSLEEFKAAAEEKAMNASFAFDEKRKQAGRDYRALQNDIRESESQMNRRATPMRRRRGRRVRVKSNRNNPRPS